MTLTEIKQAIDSGKRVFWVQESYEVLFAPALQNYVIKCHLNQNIIGLTWRDGITLNGKPSDFFSK